MPFAYIKDNNLELVSSVQMEFEGIESYEEVEFDSKITHPILKNGEIVQYEDEVINESNEK